MSVTDKSSRESNLIVRIAAKGDGITADGRHVAFSAPEDMINADGGLTRGPHYRDPSCRHFQECGGCTLQHLDDESYANFVTERVKYALEGQGLSPGQLFPPRISAPKSRIRASLRATRLGSELKLGFSGSGSHRIVNLEQCEIMRPELFAILAPLRSWLRPLARRKHDLNIELTLVDQGVDLLIRNFEPENLQQRESLAAFARENDLARLSVDGGYGPETQWEPEPVTVTLGRVSVSFPHASFLQATTDGQELLISKANEVVAGSRLVADLFAGLGTFALGLSNGRKIYAAEGSRDAIGALKLAANASKRSIFTEHRDLFRRPLSVEELNRFDAVILDPPRAGARDQVSQLAQSEVGKICYISCNPASFARDAKTLCQAGYVLEKVWPVGQFLWSTHVELVSQFSKNA
ncbi:MAG: class I SAM-dependent RNA methyltransferase [Pseudomonadota bacterium]